MDETIDATDLVILDALREVHSHLDPAPAGLEERLKFALTVHGLHAEVAELTRTPLSVARADEVTHTESITFASGTVSLMVSFSDQTADSVTVDGWVTRGGAEVELQIGNGIHAARADVHGRFTLRDVPRGRGSFVIWPDPDTDGSRPVVTPAVDL
ncbi:hypothetical protein [Euzebya sp.]|uniref:hypothetical protein n=1 Tax=Euzebya sp. TaxID=1971409 RepID=UPI003516B194